MLIHWRWRLGAVALVLLSIALLGGSHLCGVALNGEASDPGMRPIGDSALACTEFWLNRYQTLLAGFFAAGIALVALRSLKFGRQQAEAAAKQTLIMNFDYSNKRLSNLENILEEWRGLRNAVDRLHPIDALHWADEQFEAYINDITSRNDKVKSLIAGTFLRRRTKNLYRVHNSDHLVRLVNDLRNTIPRYNQTQMRPPAIQAINEQILIFRFDTDFEYAILHEINIAEGYMSKLEDLDQ